MLEEIAFKPGLIGSIQYKHTSSRCALRKHEKNNTADEDKNIYYTTTGPLSWQFETINGAVILSNNSRDAVFHPIYSSGTACVMGSEKLKHNMHYYWEMQIISCLYGTDVIFGIGAKRLTEINNMRYQYLSLLGSTEDSWGLSYNGDIIHNGLGWAYTNPFCNGSLLGIHVDMCVGRIEFYLDRKPLGIAFKNIRNVDCELYPMITSTAARSAVRLTCSIEVPSSLQLNCLMEIGKKTELIEQFEQLGGLKKLYEQTLFWVTPEHQDSEKYSAHVWKEKKKSNRNINTYREFNNNETSLFFL